MTGWSPSRDSLPSRSPKFEFPTRNSDRLAPTLEGPRPMDLFVGVRDGDWYALLANLPGLDAVSF